MLVRSGTWDHVICENFLAQNISHYGILTVRIVGGIEAICLALGIPLTIQQNVMRVPYKPRAVELMKEVYGKKHPRDHEMDALAHMLCWEAKNARMDVSKVPH